jgi:hypothetical protein
VVMGAGCWLVGQAASQQQWQRMACGAGENSWKTGGGVWLVCG